jgi:hypothetical protein
VSKAQPSQVLEQHNGGEFRFYRYTPEDGSDPVDLLSVTSIRNLCGEGYQLVNWKMANLADAALGTMKRTVIGPRGGVSEKRMVWEYPSEFARKYNDAVTEEGGANQQAIDDLRKWLREQADEPRNIAAVRGTLAHEAIEKNVMWDRIERPYVESAFALMSRKDRNKVKRAINDEDVSFVRNTVRHYWAMRAEVPMVILAREVRVVNLTAGYAGTFDALVWLLGTFTEEGEFVPLPEAAQAEARKLKADRVTLADVQRIGGTLVMLDWKTSKGVHTDQVVQAHAYLVAEFAVTHKVDERITDLLRAAMHGGLAHLRPSGWALHMFPYEEGAVRAFFGSVAFARFLAQYPKPEAIFAVNLSGASNEVDEEVAND